MRVTLFFIAFSCSANIFAQNIGINTTGSAANALNMLEVLQISTTANSVGIYANHSGSITGTGYGLRAITSGASTTNVGGYFSATGATNNYAGIFENGNVGIGSTTPAAKLTIATSTALDGIYHTDGARWMRIMAGTTGNGSYNNMVLANDNAIIYSAGAAGTGGFVIAPWAAASTGLRMDNNGNIGVGYSVPSTKLHIDFDAPNTTLTGLTAYGGIHLDQSATNDEFTGITTTATSSGTQGGILFQGSGAYGTKIHFLTTNSYAAGMFQRMIIDHVGNVGIGTTAPSRRLTVQNPTATSTNNQLLYLKQQPNDYGYSFNIDDVTTGRMYIQGVNNGVETNIMTMDRTNAYVGIGTTAPNRKLEVLSGNSDGITFGQVADNTQTIQTYIDGQWTNRATYAGGCCNGLLIQPDVGYVAIGTAAPSGSYKLEVSGRLKTTGINETSDIRLKKNISPIDNALSKVEQLRGVMYEWRADEFKDKGLDTTPQIGLIAQEVEKIFPQLVGTDNAGFKSVEYSKVVAVLIEAIKDQQKIIASQRTEIGTLNGTVKDMQRDISSLKNSFEILLNQKNSAAEK